MHWNDLPYCDEAERIDDAPASGGLDVEQSMRDLARTNFLFGGTGLILHHVSRLLQDKKPGDTVRILDIATGSADIPHALHTWARRRGLLLQTVGVDGSRAMLDLAHGVSPETQRVQADARCLPFAPRSFDIVLCALAFHHLGFDESVRLLAMMDRLSTRGFVVSDLRRDKISLWAVQTGMLLLNAHPWTRHDGPASVRRAFTPREYARMIALSGVRRMRIQTFAHLRVALVQDKAAWNGYNPVSFPSP